MKIVTYQKCNARQVTNCTFVRPVTSAIIAYSGAGNGAQQRTQGGMYG
jgi:hypothetical protein